MSCNIDIIIGSIRQRVEQWRAWEIECKGRSQNERDIPLAHWYEGRASAFELASESLELLLRMVELK